MSSPLSDETFHILREFIYEKSGLSFPDGKKYLIESRLAPRLQAIHGRTYEDYLNFIRFDPGREKELVQLLNCVTTNETFFFRDISQLDCFRKVILPQVIAAREKTRSLKIWSAGCSSGEEPFTLAMVMAEEFPKLANWDVQILATDLSEQMLHAAERGVYGPYAVRNIPAAYLKKYFTSTDGKFFVVPTIRQYVNFSRLNLFDSLQMRFMKDIDILFCRNVLIYFDQNVRKKIISHFFDSLRPTGALIIGFSESLSGVNRLFRPIPWHKTFFYSKADQGLPSTLEAGMEAVPLSASQPSEETIPTAVSGITIPMQPQVTPSMSTYGSKNQSAIQGDQWKLKGKVL